MAPPGWRSEWGGTLVNIEQKDFDVVIVGGGLAALRAAIAAAERPGLKIAIVCKRKVGRSGSSANTTGAYATSFHENGIDDEREQVAPGGETADSPEIHFRDTMMGGNGVNDPTLARIACEEGPLRLKEWIDWGIEFIREGGHLHKVRSGDHSFARVVAPINHQGTDETLVLLRVAQARGVVAIENTMAIDLALSGGRVAGVLGLDRTAGKLVALRTKTVVLATGGCGRLFSRTSNPIDVTGDGYVIAFRAGARLRDMEFIQYYPWRCIHPFDQGRMPIQPSTFALGGKLFNADGERFMLKYDPVRKDATFRAIAARGIYDQIRFRKTVDDGVLLDISEVPRDEFVKTNPRLMRVLGQRGLDPYQIRMIVAPEAHFYMGGVCIETDGSTGVPGLYAAGETTGGIHGSNRLDSTAVPDTQVFGKRAGDAAAAYARIHTWAPLPKDAIEPWVRMLDPESGNGEVTAALLKDRLILLRERTWFHLGIIRNAKTLADGFDFVEAERRALRDIKPTDMKQLEAWIELSFLLETARFCLTAALVRTESRGAHCREDFPDQNDARWQKALVLSQASDGDIRVVESDCALAGAGVSSERAAPIGSGRS